MNESLMSGIIKGLTGEGIGTLILIFVVAFLLKFSIDLIPSGKTKKRNKR